MKIFFFCFVYFINLILVLKPSTIHCPDNRLILTVQLNDIDPNHIFLGDENCKSNWSNKTHAQFLTQIENCSLVLKKKY